MTGISLESKGLSEYGALLDRVPVVAVRAARIALNYGARRARTKGAKEIRKQVNLSASYVNSRLVVSKRATDTSLYSVVSGRARPTSLVRFNARRLRKGVRVAVKPGSVKKIRRGFFINLRAGSGDAGGNVGLAIRLRKGESFNNRRKGITGKSYTKGSALALLYGPSVDQVFRTVRDDILDDVDQDIENEFHRQFERLI